MSEPSRFLTPPQVAALFHVRVHSVLAWLKSGELAGFNAAARPDGRPRWRVAPAALAKFQERRAAQVPVTPTPRRRKHDLQVIAFF